MNFDDSGFSLRPFSRRTNIHVTPTWLRTSWTLLVCQGRVILAVFLCRLWRRVSLFFIHTNWMLQYESKAIFFPDCWKFSSVVSVFTNVGERSMAKNYHFASFLSLVSKVFEKLVNNSLIDHLKKVALLSYFQCGFISCRLTSYLLTVASDRIASDCNRSGVTRAVALGISRASDRVWHACLLHKRKTYEVPGQAYGLTWFFLAMYGFVWFRIGNLCKSIQLILVLLGDPFLFLHFPYYLLMIFLVMLSIILLSILMILLSTLLSIIYTDDIILYSIYWSGIWFVAATSVGFWTCIWSTRY